MSSQRYISDTLKRKKKKVKKIKTGLIVGAILICVGAFVYLLQIPAFAISKIQITGTMFVSQEEIEQKTKGLLEERLVWIIPRSNIFLFSKNKLEEKIKENPAVVSVRIRKHFFKTLSIEIQEQEKEMIYCTSFEKTECFYINKQGFLYGQVTDIIIPEQEIIIYNLKESKKIKDTLIEESIYQDIVLFIKNSARHNIRIGEVHLKQDDVVEFVSREHMRIITSIYDEFGKDFANLIALLEQAVVTPEQFSNIDYIDLRFGNKVFYKNRTN